MKLANKILTLISCFLIGLLFAHSVNTLVMEPCPEVQTEIVEHKYFNGNITVTTWEIRGHLYLVRGNEIIGRYDRFYNANNEKR